MTNLIILEEQQADVERCEAIVNKHFPSMNIIKYLDDQLFINDLEKLPNYSVFILDIVLPHTNGIELAKTINQTIKGAVIILVTNYIEKAADIYDTRHSYFIYKPDLDKRLPLALNKGLEEIKSYKKNIMIRNKGKTIILPTKDIICLERDLRKTLIHTKEQTIFSYEDLKYFKRELTSDFFECHRSFIVNFDCVKEYHRNSFIMCDGQVIPISRSHEKETKEAFTKYYISST